MTEPAASPVATTITLRVAEARVEDIGHASHDWRRQTSIVFRRIRGTFSESRAGPSRWPREGVRLRVDGLIQIDGTVRSNCGTACRSRCR